MLEDIKNKEIVYNLDIGFAFEYILNLFYFNSATQFIVNLACHSYGFVVDLIFSGINFILNLFKDIVSGDTSYFDNLFNLGARGVDFIVLNLNVDRIHPFFLLLAACLSVFLV